MRWRAADAARRRCAIAEARRAPRAVSLPFLLRHTRSHFGNDCRHHRDIRPQTQCRLVRCRRFRRLACPFAESAAGVRDKETDEPRRPHSCEDGAGPTGPRHQRGRARQANRSGPQAAMVRAQRPAFDARRRVRPPLRRYVATQSRAIHSPRFPVASASVSWQTSRLSTPKPPARRSRASGRGSSSRPSFGPPARRRRASSRPSQR